MAQPVLTFLFAVRLLLVAMLSIPTSLAYASGTISADDLFCTPSGQPLDATAQSALSDLEALLKSVSDETEDQPPVPHCEDCLPPFMAVPAEPVALDAPQPAFHQIRPSSGPVHGPSVRGPPLGSRAPPQTV